MLGILGGSGWGDASRLGLTHYETIDTEWGPPSAPVGIGEFATVPVAFLPRHGRDHQFAPHEVNYRANIAALQKVGVTRILALNAVGGIAPELAPGDLVAPDQLIDYTWGRELTFREGQSSPVLHVDFTEPFDAGMRSVLLRSAGQDCQVRDGGVYGVVQGPRFETAAEILRMERDGCTLVGMTGMPEAYLARERSLPYVMLAIVANFAAGKGVDTVDHNRVEQVLADCVGKVSVLLRQALKAGL